MEIILEDDIESFWLTETDEVNWTNEMRKTSRILNRTLSKTWATSPKERVKLARDGWRQQHSKVPMLHYEELLINEAFTHEDIDSKLDEFLAKKRAIDCEDMSNENEYTFKSKFRHAKKVLDDTEIVDVYNDFRTKLRNDIVIRKRVTRSGNTSYVMKVINHKHLFERTEFTVSFKRSLEITISACLYYFLKWQYLDYGEFGIKCSYVYKTNLDDYRCIFVQQKSTWCIEVERDNVDLKEFVTNCVKMLNHKANLDEDKYLVGKWEELNELLTSDNKLVEAKT